MARLLLPLAMLLINVSLLAAETTPYSVRAFDPRVQHGIDLIYNLQFETADRYFEEIIAADPANPRRSACGCVDQRGLLDEQV